MEIKIKTLTPIWTGGINRCSKELRETSLIGSLRWWFEALVRGLGCYACDPNRETKCVFDSSDNRSIGKQICPVCYVFGTTGWQRRFRIEVKDKNLENLPFSKIVVNNNRGWFLGSSNRKTRKEYGGFFGTFILKFYVIDNDFENYKNLLYLISSLAANWGIGGKISFGFGVCKIETRFDIEKTIDFLLDLKVKFNQLDKKEVKKRCLDYPNFKDFFFAKIKINEENIKSETILKYIYSPNKEKLKEIYEKYGFYPTSPIVRYWLRNLFRYDKSLRHYLFGFVSIGSNKHNKELSTGSKIFVSNIYKINNHWEFKIWGYIPKSKNKAKDILEEKIKNKEFSKYLKLDKNSIDVEWVNANLEIKHLLPKIIG